MTSSAADDAADIAAASDMAVLRDISEQASDGEPVEIVAMHAAFWSRELLGVRDCRLGWTTEPASPAGVDLGVTGWATSDGWPTSRASRDPVDLPMHLDGRVVGRFVLTPEPGRRVLPDRLMTATALADLVAGARAHSTGPSSAAEPTHRPPHQRSIHG